MTGTYEWPWWGCLAVAVASAGIFWGLDRTDRPRFIRSQLAPPEAWGWSPSPEVRAHARATLVHHHRLRSLMVGSSAGISAGVLAWLGVPWQNLSLVFPLAITGYVVGTTLAHLRSGQMPVGPRVAEAHPRTRSDFLRRTARLVSDGWLIGAVLVGVPVMTYALLDGSPRATAVAGVATAGVVLAVATAVLTRASLRHPLPAADQDDAHWQAWVRGRVLYEIGGLAWIACCVSLTALWLGLTWAWPGAADGLMPYAVLVTVVLALGVPVWWFERGQVPPLLKREYA